MVYMNSDKLFPVGVENMLGMYIGTFPAFPPRDMTLKRKVTLQQLAFGSCDKKATATLQKC